MQTVGNLSCRAGACQARGQVKQRNLASRTLEPTRSAPGRHRRGPPPAAVQPAAQPEQAGAAPGAGAEGYDVYVYQPQPLEEGVRKHTLSVFVADESGLINRVAGVFARRGANIESLAVGLTVDKALFTIVATGTDATVANLAKQLAKLVNVRYVEDITGVKRIERELMMVKVHAPAGPVRGEVLQLAQTVRSRVVEVADETVTLVVTGDAGKMAAVLKALARFGIDELARTGRVALKRGEQLFDSTAAWEGRAPSAAGRQAESSTPPPDEPDVYANSGETAEGVWAVQNVLDAAYDPALAAFEPYTLSIEVQDRPGVLNQVTGVFARRGYNVQSLAVGNCEREGMSRIVMVVPGDTAGIANLVKQLNKLVYVEKVTELHTVPHVAREMMLLKVSCTPAQRSEVLAVAQIFRGSVVDVSAGTIMLEVVGRERKMLAVQEVLEPYGILEIARTGRISMTRESGVDTKYLQGITGSRVML